MPGMSSHTLHSSDIIDWLTSACEGIDSATSNIHDYHNSSKHVVPHRETKRVFPFMDGDMSDLAPRPKRPRSGIATPFSSNEETRLPTPFERPAPTLSPTRSGATSSRASSPSKRAREIENEFSKPEIKLYSTWRSTRWIEDRGSEVPLLQELRAMIATAEIIEQDVPTAYIEVLDDLLITVAECTEEKVPEDTWSDLVVHPALLMARGISQYTSSLKVLNVKSIDIAPKDLLPINASLASIPTKRVDYTIGLEFADEETTHQVRKSIPGPGHTFNQTVHQMTSHRVLCSHLEIKIPSSADDAMPQLSTWTAANFLKLENLWLHRHRKSLLAPRLAMAPIPLWHWRGAYLHLYIAVMDSAKELLHILYVSEYVIATSASLWRIILVLVRVMDWGVEHYLPWFKNFVGFE